MLYYLPAGPLNELLLGYKWDLSDSNEIHSEEELLEYCTYVAGSVGSLVLTVAAYRSDHPMTTGWLDRRARETGRALQLINVARDIVTDSRTLGRVYVPSDYFQVNITSKYFQVTVTD